MASRALLIGVPNPQPTRLPDRVVTWPELHGVGNDLAAVRHMLLEADQPLPDLSIITLIEPDDTTATNIKVQLDRHLGQLEPGDTFILMLNGHGYRVPDVDGDEDDGWDEVFIASDGAPVLDDEFALRWKELHRDVTVIGLVDTCYADTSGLLIDHPARLLPAPALPVTYWQDDGASRLFFSASLQDEEAFETQVPGVSRGVMSAALTDVWFLTRGARRSYETLFGYAHHLANQYDRRQTTRARFVGRESAPILSRPPFSVAHVPT